MVGLPGKHASTFLVGPSFSPPSHFFYFKSYRGGRSVPLPCWYLVVLAESILLWSMWQRLLQRCLTIREVFGSGWDALKWWDEKWGVNLAREIEKWSSVRYDNLPPQTRCVKQVRQMLSSNRLEALKKKGRQTVCRSNPPKRDVYDLGPFYQAILFSKLKCGFF